MGSAGHLFENVLPTPTYVPIVFIESLSLLIGVNCQDQKWENVAVVDNSIQWLDVAFRPFSFVIIFQIIV